MFNRRFEASTGSRSEETLRSALFPPFFQEPGTLFPIVDDRSIELAAMFREEERLASLITEGQPMPNGASSKTVNKDTIYQVVAIARKIAKGGFPTTLVGLDEMLDIAEIYQSNLPSVSAVNQLMLHLDPVHEYPHSTPSDILFVIESIRKHGPNAATAEQALVNLLSTLDQDRNPVWTARVAAALTYFSVETTK